MKGSGKLIMGLLLGGISGWALGFLRLPLVERNDSFWVGLLVGVSAVLLILMLKTAFGSGRTAKAVPRSSRWISLTVAFVISGTLLIAWGLSAQNETRAALGISEELQLAKQEALVAAQNQANLGQMIAPLIKEIQQEVAENLSRSLSAETIEKIARLSNSFEPYSYLSADSLQTQKLSPQRGQLLLSLLSISMDTATFRQIRSKVTFAGADLEGAKLAGLDLRGIDLMGAKLRDAGLNDADLRDADLRGANLWGAQMKRADLSKVDMRRADVRWAELEEATLRYSLLDGADFSNALMRKADLYDAKFQYGNMSGAMLSEAFLSCADFELTKMNKIDCSFSDLSMSNLKRAEVNEANFRGAELTGITVEEEDWIGKLPERKVAGKDEIQAKYQIAKDSIVRYANSKYILIPISREDTSAQN